MSKKWKERARIGASRVAKMIPLEKWKEVSPTWKMNAISPRYFHALGAYMRNAVENARERESVWKNMAEYFLEYFLSSCVFSSFFR